MTLHKSKKQKQKTNQPDCKLTLVFVGFPVISTYRVLPVYIAPSSPYAVGWGLRPEIRVLLLLTWGNDWEL